jgi:hypothetical protein
MIAIFHSRDVQEDRELPSAIAALPQAFPPPLILFRQLRY